jgi:hypothetical protein
MRGAAAFVATLDSVDRLVVTLVTIGLVGLIHAVAYTSAQGALRPQRIMLCRSADLLAIAGVVFLIRMWTRS